MNPKWCTDYLQFIKDSISDTDGSITSCHVVLTTHNPLSIATLRKEQVQILIRNDGKIEAKQPDIDPRGMGYAGIVTSDIFGLDSSLDSYTLSLLEERRQITQHEKALTQSQKIRLEQIQNELEPYGFKHEARDPEFKEYLLARREALQDRINNQKKELITTKIDPEKAKQIVTHIIKKNKGDK